LFGLSSNYLYITGVLTKKQAKKSQVQNKIRHHCTRL